MQRTLAKDPTMAIPIEVPVNSTHPTTVVSKDILQLLKVTILVLVSMTTVKPAVTLTLITVT